MTDIRSAQGLRRNYLSGFELIFQSLGTVAPCACLALLLPVIFAQSGTSTWLALLFAGVGISVLALLMAEFGRRMASPGALYAYVHAGLAPLRGVIPGISILLAYILFVATIPPQLANLISGLLQVKFHVTPGLTAILAMMTLSVALPWWLAQRDIKLSTRLTSVVEITTMVLILFLLGDHFRHKGSLVSQPQIDLSGFTFNQFHLGLVLAFLCYGGFETAMELGAEARRPFKVIPRILLTIVGLLALFFTFGAYGLTDAFQDIQPSLDKQDAPFTTLAHSLDLDNTGVVITAGIFSSLFASSLGCINAAGRMLYAFAHRGLFFRAIGATHTRHATPHRGIAVVSLTGLGIALILTVCGVAPSDQLNYVGSLSSISILVPYGMVAVAAPVYMKKLGMLKAWHVCAAVFALCCLAVPLIGSLYPVPDYPLNLLPYIYLGLMALGMGYFLYVRKTNPDRLRSVESELLLALPNQSAA